MAPADIAAAAAPLPEGVRYLPLHYDAAAQARLLAAVRAVIAGAPLFTPHMPGSGRPFSVRMTNCGALGWVSDRAGGYRYEPAHPATGLPWPPLPAMLAELWAAVAPEAPPPQACLVNYYATHARMGLHVDRDEEDFAAPIVSVSLGDDARFLLGGTARSDPAVSLRLRSGDVLVMGGPARLAYHGVARLYAGTSTILPEGGRINLTMRRVRRA